MENVTHLKNRTLLFVTMVFLSVGQHLSLRPDIKTLSSDDGKLSSRISPNSVKLNQLFRSIYFHVLLKNICSFVFGISWAFQNVVKILLDNIRLDFFLNVSQHMQ